MDFPIFIDERITRPKFLRDSFILPMTERVHPAGKSPELPEPSPAVETKPMLTSPSYVIQVPKDQIYRHPPPENAYKFERYTKRAKGRRRSCCCYLLVSLVILVVAAGATAGILYLVFRPKLPSYSVESLILKGFNLSSGTISPRIDLTVVAVNPNKKIGIHYKSNSEIRIVHSGVDLCSGEWPEFYQGKGNTTVVRTVLTGSEIELSDTMRSDLTAQEKKEAVPLGISIRVPVRIKFGAVTTWTFTVRARCDVEVNGLRENSKVVDGSTRCKFDD